MMAWLKDRVPKSWAFWLVIAGLILSALGMYFGWDWLRSGATEKEPNSTTIRNAGIVIAGIFALVFALWRGLVAERQAAASQRQAETSQQGLLNERYQKGAEMLGSKVLAVRLGGIYALQRLAEEHPEQYHLQIIELLCAFVRNPTGDKDGPVLRHDEAGDPAHGLREDVQAIMRAIGNRSDVGIALEESDRNFHLYLPSVNIERGLLSELNLAGALLHESNLFGAHLIGTNFSDAYLESANFSRAHLIGANLSSASLIGANFSDSVLDSANLSKAIFRSADLLNAGFADTNLTDADLVDANLTGASFIRDRGIGGRLNPATGLTQAQLDEARSDPDNPPRLEGVLDAETGEQLVWRGRPLDEDSVDSYS